MMTEHEYPFLTSILPKEEGGGYLEDQDESIPRGEAKI